MCQAVFFTIIFHVSFKDQELKTLKYHENMAGLTVSFRQGLLNLICKHV